MKRRILAAVSVFLAMAFFLPETGIAGEGFQQVYDNLDLKKNTKLHVKEYWKGVEGKDVSWSGTVHDVKGGRGKAEVLIVNRSRATHRGYNIALIVYDTAKAARLKKGQQIKFRGNLHDYAHGRHGGVLLTLREGELL